MPNSVDGADPDHFLALKLARDALKDAGYLDRPFNREKTGIILGRGTYFNRGFGTVLQHGMIVDQTLELLRQLNPGLDEDTLSRIRKELKASLPPFTAEMSPGLVPNVVTGRIANRLDLMGPNYIVDAACSSSLVAVELAIKELLSDRCDMMLAGGVQASTPPQVHMVFCQLGALSHSNIRPFDQSADGTLLSEGLGTLVLKRLADAERDGDRIYAVIKGIGTSSDGKALGLLAPRLEGEVLALQRAYRDTGIDPETVELVEAHGTGIPLGDQTEVRSMSQVFGQRRGLMPHCGLGSVKSMLGHCIPASGVASIIKMALALYHKILPPTLCDQVNPALEIEKTPFYINTEPRPWIHGDRKHPRRAGVNAFGFGGINTHAILEEYKEPQEAKLPDNPWPTELLLFSGNGLQDLMAAIDNVQQILQVNPSQPLANLAYTLSTRAHGTHRLAIIAKDVPDLQAKVHHVVEKLKNSKRTRLQTRTGVYYAQSDSTAKLGKIAFLFPGEGAQYPNMLADLCLYFPKVRAWFDFLDEIFAGTREHPPSHFIFPPPTGLTDRQRLLVTEKLYSLDLATETVFTASMALYELLRDLGVPCDAMLGHSTGENTALIASGTVKLAERSQIGAKIHLLNQIYRDLEGADSIPKGALLTVGAVEPAFVQQLVDNSQGRLHLAIDNCPNQAVLFGSESDIDRAVTQLKEQGGICTRLPFDRAYHTPLFASVGAALKDYYNALDVGSGHTCLYSCTTTEAFPSAPEAIRALAVEQWSTRVRFRETIEKLYDKGIKTFIEVGPGGNLTNFVKDILQKRNHLAVASNTQRRSGLEQIQQLLGQLFVNGMAINIAALYKHREVAEVNLDAAISLEHSPQRANPILNLTMPGMHLKSDFVQEIQDKLYKLHQVNPEPVPLAWSPQENSVQPQETWSPQENSVQPQEAWSLQEHPVQPQETWNLQEHPVQSQETWNLQEHPVQSQETWNLQEHPVQPQEAWSPQENSVQPQETWNLQEYPVQPQEYFMENQLPSSSPLSVDPRLSVVSAHFELMQEFLASQARVITNFYSGASTYDNAEASPSPVSLTTAVLTHEEAWPLLGQIIEKDGQHLWCERHFDMEHDIFIHDHTLGGPAHDRHPDLSPLPVIPFTISMEILAEAAACLFDGTQRVTGIYNVRSYRWLALEQGQLALGILAKLQSQPAAETWDVHVQLFQLNTAQATDSNLVFEGYVRLSDQFSPSPTPTDFFLENPKPSRWSDAQLYTEGMFHGPRLQGVKHIRQVSQQGIEADLQVMPIANFFSHTQRPVFQIDAPVLDAAAQLVAYWGSESFGVSFHTFPFQVRSFEQYGMLLSPGEIILCRGLIGFTSDRQIDSSFDFLDQSGHVVARMEGFLEIFLKVPQEYHQCRVAPQSSYWSKPWLQVETGLVCRRIEPLPPGFFDELGGVIKHIVAHLILTEKEREFWYNLPLKGSRRSEWLLGRIVAKDALRQWAKQRFNLDLTPMDIQILPDHLGKPLLYCPKLEAIAPLPDVSISHGRNYFVGAIAEPGMRIGIDLQRLDAVGYLDWLELAFTPKELELLAQLPQQNEKAIIIGAWCAKEAAAKAAGTGLNGNPKQWQVSQFDITNQKVAIAHVGEIFQIKLYFRDGEILAICHNN
jgi:acyl transferase domain-containing protein/phosphopantetheinyl transferase